jgi:hypothetical protein
MKQPISQHHQLSFFTEYYQFYIQDSQTTSQTDDANFWNTASETLRLAVVEGLLGVTVAQYAEIKVEVRVLDSAPALTAADHIVEASLRLNSGVLEVKNCTNFETQLELLLPKGAYKIRVSSYQLATVVNDAEGNDYYIVEIWKGRFAKPKVLKKWGATA